MCYPWFKPYNQSKVQPKSKPCIFLGYSSSKSAYKCFDAATNRLFYSRHVKFVENILPLAGTSNGSSPATKLLLTDFSSRNNNNKEPADPIQPSPPLQSPSGTTLHLHEPIQTIPHPSATSTNQQTPNTVTYDEPVSPPTSSPPPSQSHSPTFSTETSPTPTSSIQSTTEPHNRPSRVRQPNTKYFNSNFINNTVVKHSPSIPPSRHPTLASLEPTCVSHAMSTKFNALMQNRTWDLVPGDENKNVVGCKWVFRIKRKSDSTIERYKAALSPKDFINDQGLISQKHSVQL